VRGTMKAAVRSDVRSKSPRLEGEISPAFIFI